jgi:hypothetical protein
VLVPLVAVLPVQSSTGTIEPGQQFNAEPDHAEDLIRSGHATSADRWPPRWCGIEWLGADVVIMASGPSITAAQCEQVMHWRETAFRDYQPGAAGPLRRTIVVNTTFRLAPWADVLYACDAPWWRIYHAEVLEVFKGELWTQDERATKELGINRIESRNLPGIGKHGGVIHQGGNGGHQAINLAFQAGARRIILLGFDFQGTHWHGKHPAGLPNPPDHIFKHWLASMDETAHDLRAAGIEVLNCSPSTAIQCFKRANLGDALC